MLKKVLLVTAAAGLLSACADRWDVDGARSMANGGGAFEQALQKEYADLAAAERGRYDWGDAAYFIRKARAAASGQTVLPTALEERDLDDRFIGEATTMRAELMEVLNSGARTAMPQMAARAQAAGFDCFLEEAEEGHQPDDIAACKATFDAAMAALKGKAPKAAVAPVNGPFVVYFKTGSFQLDETAMSVLQAAATAYKSNKDVVVVVSGYTDTAGNANANILLSQKRAEAVATALAKLGVSASAMALEAYGEEKLQVSTPNDRPESQNRRVEITFKPEGK
ncbi:OmpA family protein [Insolitispirillum peregrinum]